MQILIVTADDFGLTPGVSRGILETAERGLVTAISVMVCTAPAIPLLEQHAAELRGRAGVHLQLTGGKPALPPEEVPSLVTSEGMFPRTRAEQCVRRGTEIELEWRAQVERFRAAGMEPAHLDSHHHVHQEPAAFIAFCRIARHYGLPARACDERMRQALRAQGIVCADRFIGRWTGKDCTADGLLAAVNAAFAASGGAGVVELGTHPGYVDDELRSQSILIESREKERSVLCDPDLAARLDESGIVRRGMAAAGGAAG